MRQALRSLLILSLVFLSNLGTSVAFSSEANEKAVAKTKPTRTDSFGDPLPDGVFYRLGTVRLRHQHTKALIFSADGSRLLSQGTTADFRVWDVATGRILQQFAAPENGRQLIASPDDRYLACVANSHRVVLTDKATGKELARWEHGTAWVSLAFSKDGTELIGLTREQKVVRWNIAERKEIARIQLDMTKVDVKNFFDHWGLSPDGSIVLFMEPVAPLNANPTVPWYFWDTATGKQCRPSLKISADRSQVNWSPDGRMIAVVCRDYTLEVWDTVAGKRLPLAPAEPPMKSGAAKVSARAAVFHPGGKLLAIEHESTIAMWDLNAGKQLWKKRLILASDVLAFSPDGKTLAVGGWGVIALLETDTGERVGFSRRDPGSISLASWERSASFVRDGQSFTVYDQAGLSQVEIGSGKRLRSYYSDKTGAFYYGGLCGGGRFLACVGNDMNRVAHLFLFDAVTGKELWRRSKQPSAIDVAADGKTVAVLSWEGDEFALLDTATGREIKKLSPPSYKNDSGTTKAVSDDLQLAATTQNMRTIDLWNLASGKQLRSLECPPGWGHGSLHFLPGSESIVGAADRRFAGKGAKGEWTRVWDAATGRTCRSFAEPLLKMSADGRWLALQGDKGMVIRHLQTGRLMTAVGGSNVLGFSPDGSLVAVRSASVHEVGLWDTFTGQLVCRWVDPLCEFDGVAFAPDGRTLVLTVRSGGCMLICDVTRMATEPGKIAPQDLTADDADRYWLELTSDDGPRSHRARWTLVAGGKPTVEMLQRCMQRVEPLDAKNLAALLAGLDSGNFKEREKSSRVLERMELTRPALEDAFNRTPSLEMKRRIELILAKQDMLPLDVEQRRALRGVLLLEQIATPPARRLLQTLASGASGSLLTQEAQAALQRVAQTEEPR